MEFTAFAMVTSIPALVVANPTLDCLGQGCRDDGFQKVPYYKSEQ